MQRVWLLLVFPQLLESCHHVGSGYRLRLSSNPHPPLNQFLHELLGGVHSAMNQDCQDVADQQTFAEGDPQHLVFAQTKLLSNPFMYVLCRRATGLAFFVFLDFIAIDQSWALAIPLV